MTDPLTPPSPRPEPTRRVDLDAVQTHDTSVSQDSQAVVVVENHNFATSANASPPVAAQRIGHYELLEKLGEGGMGAVYKARHDRLKKIVAIKVLPHAQVNSVAAIARFTREMEAVGALDHPHIVRAMDAGEESGTHFLVMEYVEGIDLQKLVREQGPMSVRNACQALRHAALGLQHAHEHGLVHRDVKPSNLFLTATGQVKVLDLGLARLGGDDLPVDGLTSSGQMLGTPDFMAPEQWDDTHSVGPSADLYSLGCTLFYLLTRKTPFAGSKPRSMLQVMKAHAESPIPDLRESRNVAVALREQMLPQSQRQGDTEIPDQLVALFQKMMAKNPTERIASAKEVVFALQAILDGIDPEDSIDSQWDAGSAGGKVLHRNRILPVVSGEPNASTTGELAPRQVVTPSQTPNSTSNLNPTITFPEFADVGSESFTKPIERPAAKHRRKSVVMALGVAGLLVLAWVAIKNSTDILNSSTARLASGVGQSAGTDLEHGVTPTDSPKVGVVWQGWPVEAPPPAVAPFNAAEAQKHQDAWGKYLGVKVEFSNTVGMTFQLVPPGEFTMGTSADEADAVLREAGDLAQAEWFRGNVMSEQPARRVTISRPFFAGMFEVTVAQFRQFVEKTGYRTDAERDGRGGKVWRNGEFVFDPQLTWANPGFDDGTPDFAVTHVSWNDAMSFCRWLTRQEMREYRLLTESEWEYVCRADSDTRFSVGSHLPSRGETVDGIARNSGAPRVLDSLLGPVGTTRANSFGLFDLHGNVDEWCLDHYVTHPTRYVSKVDPVQLGDGQTKVNRGGSASTPVWMARSASRGGLGSTDRVQTLGFRVRTEVQPSLGTQRAAAETVLRLGGSVVLDVDGQPVDVPSAAPLPDDGCLLIGINFDNIAGITDGRILDLPALPRLTFLDLTNTAVTDEAVLHLAGYPALKDIYFGGTSLTDRGLIGLAKLPVIKLLSIHNTRVTDAGLVALRSAPQLYILGIDGRQFTEQSLPVLRDLPDLAELHLVGPDINDARIQPIAQLPQLRRVVLSETRVTDDGLRRLRAHRPELEVNRK